MIDLNETTNWVIPVFCLDAKGIVSLNEGLSDKANEGINMSGILPHKNRLFQLAGGGYYYLTVKKACP